MTEREAFGPTLRRERERRGISLEAIAHSTKISAGVLEALERNDLSRWPTGIFRRSFMRHYAAAIGLAPEEVLSDFLRLFPESQQPGDQVACGASIGSTENPSPLRLQLAPDKDGLACRLSPAQRRWVAVGVEVLLIGVIGKLAAAVLHQGFWTTVGVTAITYHAASLVACGGSVALAYLTCTWSDVHWRPFWSLRLLQERPHAVAQKYRARVVAAHPHSSRAALRAVALPDLAGSNDEEVFERRRA